MARAFGRACPSFWNQLSALFMLVHQHGRNRSGSGASSPRRLPVVLPLMLLTLFVCGNARADCNLTEIKPVVQFQGQAAAELFVTAIQGDFSADEATFLNNSHTLEWRGKAQGLGDFTFSSHRSGRLIESKAKGTMPWTSGDLQVDVTSNVDHYFESSSGGSQTITDNLLTGTMTGAGFQLTINQFPDRIVEVEAWNIF